MRIFLLFLPLLAACGGGPDAPGAIWYEHMDVVCHDDGCRRCRGSCVYDCPKCRGEGEIQCRSCRDGTQRCGTCKGDGSRHGKPCKRCGGSGRSACSRCGGDRMMKCQTCEGKAKVMCIRQMRVTVPEVTNPEVAWPPGNVRMPDE